MHYYFYLDGGVILYLALVGYVMIFVMMYLLMKGKATPIPLFIILPIIGALFAGYSIFEANTFIKAGIGTVTGNAVLFLFSVIYFGIMSDLGIFDPLVNLLLKLAGKNVVAITVATAIIGVIGHLDGATATTVLITVPTLLPVYKRMGMSPLTLLALTAASMGFMNLVPWGGPTARAAAVTGIDATALWHKLIPIQGVALVCVIALAIYLGLKEKSRGAGLSSNAQEISDHLPADGDVGDKKLLAFNLSLTVALIALLFWGKLQSNTVFMLVTALAVVVNYKGQKAQEAALKKHAPAAFLIAGTMLASGVLVGVLNESVILKEMAAVVLNVLPGFLARHLHLIMGVLGLPVGMVLGTDAYFYGLMPLCIEVASNYGVTSENMAMAMLLGKNVGLLISPLVPATFLAIGLADVDLKEHIKYSFPYLLIISIVMVFSGVLFGIISL